MKTIQFKMHVGLLTEEEQKEFDFIDGKLKRGSIVYHFERARYKELFKQAELNLMNNKFNAKQNENN